MSKSELFRLGVQKGASVEPEEDVSPEVAWNRLIAKAEVDAMNEIVKIAEAYKAGSWGPTFSLSQVRFAVESIPEGYGS